MPTLKCVGIFYLMRMQQDNIKIGFISKTHGLKGEVTAVLENDGAWTDDTTLLLELNGSLIPYFIERTSGQANKPIIKFEGINSIEQATMLKGRSIYSPKSDRPKSKPGQFHDNEIIDFQVEDKELGTLGIVKEIQNQGVNKLILVLNGTKEILIPVNAPFIKKVNKLKKTIQVELPDRFLDF